MAHMGVQEKVIFVVTGKAFWIKSKLRFRGVMEVNKFKSWERNLYHD